MSSPEVSVGSPFPKSSDLRSVMSEIEQNLIGLAGIIVLGIGGQCIAARLRVPSILLLLLIGFIAGPITHSIEPDRIFEGLLFPVISLSVAIILFEGGLSLKLDELRQIGRVLVGLLTIGIATTWLLTTLAAWKILGMPPRLALLCGSILIVTGPTVIGPMLRLIRPIGKIGPIAQWEGIVIDPIGATLAVLVYDFFHSQHAMGALQFDFSLLIAFVGLLETTAVGLICGSFAAGVVVLALQRFWLPDRLHSPALLAMVVAAFTVANIWCRESGMLAVTVMGVLLANQKRVAISRFVEFKENLTVLLISGLFIILSARLKLENLTSLGWRGVAFVLFVILIVRPVAVWLSSVGSNLTWQERVFLSWFAPRGIVAAAVASVFAIRLGDQGHDLVPAVFVVIVGTVSVYSLTAFPLARRLGLAVTNPQGVLIASAHPGARAIAHALQSANFRVVLLDSNRVDGNVARMEGLTAQTVDLLDENTIKNVDFGGLGRFLALTSSDEVNALVSMRFREVFGSSEVYQLSPIRSEGQVEVGSLRVHGRILFATGLNYEVLDQRFEAGAVIKQTKLTKEFTYADFVSLHGTQAIPLFVIDPVAKLLTVCVPEVSLKITAGQILISLMIPEPAGE